MATKKTDGSGSRVYFQYMNADINNPNQEVITPLSEHELTKLIEDGYLLLDSYFSGHALTKLRNALDQITAAEKNMIHDSHETAAPKRFGGYYYNNLYWKHPAFAIILEDQLLISTAKMLLGPLIWARPLSARIVDHQLTDAETHWHQHLATAPKPYPAWFVRSHSLEVLIYLDAIDERTGSLIVLPGSHKDPHGDLQPDQYEDIAGQRIISCNAGSIVLMHGGTFHRATPGQEVSLRRLLVTAFQPTWMKRRSYGDDIQLIPEGYDHIADANMLFGNSHYS